MLVGTGVGELVGLDVGEFVLSDQQRADVPAPDPARELAAVLNINGLTCRAEADSPREKWPRILARRVRDRKVSVYGSGSAAEPAKATATDAPELDDGAEYSPDGEFIYFNSSRTGTMQLWRMKPDGSQQEQLTDGEFNSWFPHISPDGTKIVYLAYRPDVEASDHPWYKHVYLMMMPVDGGNPSVLANVYGGQGTINVPSWSPDSRYVAFVSNTGSL